VLDESGEPVYGPRDAIDTAKFAALGLPFWLAGSYGSPARLREALDAGATGIQVGTLFAMSRESGFAPELRDALLASLGRDGLATRTDVLASPTGFPFKVASIPGTLSDVALREDRTSVCDLGHLRTPFRREDGSVNYRCPAEPVAMYERKGGEPEDADGRVCLCNALTASAGMAQIRKDGSAELPLITLGDDLEGPRTLLASHPLGWSATTAVAWLRGEPVDA
jgi:NAD(P)H-dependent flavin oxidoreductase YrpB (nitropropane dioxygenase family)